MMPSHESKNNEEHILEGGTLTRVVRIGETVRRPVGAWTQTIHALLRHLDERGFSGCPKVLGVDENQREILSFLPGRVANWPWPEVLRSDEGIRLYASLLRNYHVAVADFTPPPNAVWQNPLTGELKPGETIRHGDTGPWNTVWDSGKLVGFIDWDFAAPGSGRDDVLETLWHVAPLYSDELCEQIGFTESLNRFHRIEVFLSTYGSNLGFEVVEQIPSAVLELAYRERATTKELAELGLEPWKTLESKRKELDLKLSWLEEMAKK